MYFKEERETVILFSEQENSWSIQTNVRKHINKFLKKEDYFEWIEKEEEDGKVISIVAKLSDLERFAFNPSIKVRKRLSSKEKSDLVSYIQDLIDKLGLDKDSKKEEFESEMILYINNEIEKLKFGI